MAARILILMAAASALSVTRRALLLASTGDQARRLLSDLDEASARLDPLTKKALPTDLPSRFNVTAGPAQRTGVNQRTGYCWYELAGEWSRLEGDQCSQRDAKGRLQP